MRELIAKALDGHRLDTFNQDSGNHCLCGSDSRFEQPNGDHPWASINEHRADLVMRAAAAAVRRERDNPSRAWNFGDEPGHDDFSRGLFMGIKEGMTAAVNVVSGDFNG